MVANAVPKLPSINLSGDNATPGSSAWVLTCQNVREALEEYGCFVAVYDQLSSELHNNVFEVIEPMFELPSEVKAKNTSKIPYHGYYKPGPVMPLLDSFGIDDATVFDKTCNFTHLLWPHGNQHFCETIHEYAKKTSELEKLVTEMVFESYKVEKYLDSHLKSANYLLRIAKYRVPREDEGILGGLPHTDKNFLTVLHQNDVDGLEVQTKVGEWITYKASPNTFIVMAGELFLAWSNNRIHAPVHRVTMRGKKPRYSLMMFSRSKDTIQIPKELVDEQYPLQFKPFDYMGLLRFYTEDVTRLAFCTIKDYCGAH